MEEECRGFLGRFVEEFPAPLEEDAPLPVKPLSCKVSIEELQGESLEIGLKLLATRSAPAILGALLCQVALSQLQQKDLSTFYCPLAAEIDQDDEQVILLESAAVQHVFLNKLINAALMWHQNLPKPPPAPPVFLRCSIHAIKNKRRKMEDKHVALAEFNQLFGIQDELQRAYFAVFDGHGGPDAAVYAATHLHVALSNQQTLQSDAATALKIAFKHTDDMFKVKAKRECLRSGTTGVAVLIHGQELTVAWLGDSQAILVRKGQVVTLMDPHRPDRQDEKQRIEDLGGCVTFMGCWRVNGTYSVSRAIGDFDQKPYVSGDADCSVTQLYGDEDYILLACDGFFDSVKTSEVPNLVLNALQHPSDHDSTENAVLKELDDADGPRVAQHLVDHAKASGSTDNITVVVVFLRPPDQLMAQMNSMATAHEMQSFRSQDVLHQ